MASSSKQLSVHVTTMDAVLEFSIEAKATGKQLFDLVTRTLGLREVWYFGLMFTDVKDFKTWLRYDKKIVDQGVPKDTIANFKFRPKFYPEDVSDLVMEVTLQLFYLHCKEDILNERIYCSPEASLLLASYALQAEYGQFDEEVHAPGFLSNQRLLPPNVIEQFDLTPEQWEVQLMDWWAKYQNMLKSEAQLEYLKIAQDLDMYGINYFDITNKKGTMLWLGVDAFGLNIYNHDNKIAPKISFPWGEIRNVEYHGKKFCIMPEDRNSPDFVFYVPKTKISDLIMQLCVGNHDLYLKRRKVDTMEIQQMKAHAKEEKTRKMMERDKLEKERAARQQLEKEKKELQEQLLAMEKEKNLAYQAKLEAEARAQILEERVRMAEEQTHTLTRKKIETEAEIQRVRASALKSEEEKIVMKKKVIKAEEEAATMQQTAHQRQQEAESLRKKLERAQLSDSHLPTATNVHSLSPPPPLLLPNSLSADLPVHGGGELTNGDLVLQNKEDIAHQLEKEHHNYWTQTHYLYEKLNALQSEVNDFKSEGRGGKREGGSASGEEGSEAGRRESGGEIQKSQEIPRKLHATVVRQSSHKHYAYDKSKSGSTKSRIEFFEDL